MYFLNELLMSLRITVTTLFRHCNSSLRIVPCKITLKREIRHFHVVVVQKRQRNVQKVWCTCKVVVLLTKPTVFFTFSLRSRRWILKTLLWTTKRDWILERTKPRFLWPSLSKPTGPAADRISSEMGQLSSDIVQWPTLCSSGLCTFSSLLYWILEPIWFRDLQ